MALSSADLVEGATLPQVMQEGFLAAVFPIADHRPTVKLMLRVRVPSTSDYGSSKLATFFLVIEILPACEGSEADEEARSNTSWLLRSAGRVVSLQIGGLRVSRVVTEDNRRNVYCSAAGPRLVVAGDDRKLLRKTSLSAEAPRWAFHTPPPGPELEPDPRQQIRETSAELSPSSVNAEPVLNVHADERRPSRTQAQPVPLISHRSRSPRPLSTHVLQFKNFKRPAPGDELDKRDDKRQRLMSPQGTAQAGPSCAAVAPNRGPQQTRPFPHPMSARPPQPPLPPLGTQRRAPITERLDLGNPTAVPAPRDVPARHYLPSPSTYLSSRDTIESPFPTQESVDIEDVSISHMYQPAPTPAQVSQCSPPTSSAAARLEAPPPESTPRRSQVTMVSPDIPSGKWLSAGTSPLVAPEAQRSRSSSSAAADRAARRAAIMAQKAQLSAQLRELEELDRQEGLVTEQPEQLAPEAETHEEAAEATSGEVGKPHPKLAVSKADQGEHVRGVGVRDRASVPPSNAEVVIVRSEGPASLQTPRTRPEKYQYSRSPLASVSVTQPKAAGVAQPSPTAQLATTPASIRRAAEEHIRQENAARLAQQAAREDERVLEASRLEEPFTAGIWTYTPLGQLEQGTTRNVMGVVRRVDPAKQTKGGDWSLHLYIRDPTNTSDDDTAVTVFRPEADIQKQQFHVGQAVLFRNLKIGYWNGRPKGQAFRTPASEWYVLLGGKNVVPGGQLQPEPVCQDEITRLKALEKWDREAGSAAPAQSTADVTATGNGHASRKRKTLDEVSPGEFFDATVKIMNVQRRDTSGTYRISPKYELYITDGTVNPNPTHNFHAVDAGIPPRALMCMTVFSNVNQASERLFKLGAILHFKNINAHRYQRQTEGTMELKWSDKVTDEQKDSGWRDKACYLIATDKPEAVEIEERIKALKAAASRGEAVASTSHQHPLANDARAVPPGPVPTSPISTVLLTKHTDEALYPRSTIAQILANMTTPNRFRTLARVKAIHSRGAKGSAKGDLAVLWCKRCNNTFAKSHCQTCNDHRMKNAEVRWQLLLVLHPEHTDDQETTAGDHIVAVLDGDEAAAVLPALPPLSCGPNEIARLRKRLSDHDKFRKPVEDLLLGPKVKGRHTHPLIDWTIESYATGPNGQLDHLCFRVFGMRSGS